MNITEVLLAAKKTKGLSFSDLEKVIDHDEVWIAALFYRQASASREAADKLVAALGVSPGRVQLDDATHVLNGFYPVSRTPGKRTFDTCARRCAIRIAAAGLNH